MADDNNHKKSMMIYEIDDIPPVGEGLALGFQQYLTMFGSTVAIPFIIAGPLGLATDGVDFAKLIATMFFVLGITTMLQTTWGNRLPIVQGGTFSFLAPTFAICGMAVLKDAGWMVKMQHLQGAIIAGAICEIIVGYSGLVGKIRRYVGPITIAPTIALIGLALFKIGAPKAGLDWQIGGATIFFVILFSQYLRTSAKVFQLYPILLGMIVAWGLAIAGTLTGYFPEGHPSHASFGVVRESPLFLPPMPFQWGWPIFGMSAFVGMAAGYLASMIESIGDYYACARLSGAPNPTEETINKGIGMEGIGCFIAGCFGTGNGTTSYSENIGAIGLTRVGSRRVIQYGAGIMLVLGLFPKFGAIFASIPGPIVGGMYCTLFGMIAAVGMSNLQFVNLNSSRNLFILGFAFFMGLSLPIYFDAMSSPDLNQYFILNFGLNTVTPTWLAWLDSNVTWAGDLIRTFGKNGMAVGGMLAFFLDNTVPGTDEERGLIAWLKKD